MPVKRPSKEPAQGQRKRPRVPKFDEGNDEQENHNQPIRRADDEEEEDDVQADYMEEGGTYVEDIYIPPKLTLMERPTRGERLIIDKITCENFKSYGGIKVMGPFHKSFSAIIGPNGNGKSNIIDAMLFVFGYRAKKIRCKKVSVLIHKSELLPHVNCCAVTVHFVKIIDNGEDDLTELNVVPNSEISVCRRAYQNNSSAYWLNGRKVQFNEVAIFLKQNGIDIVHNRFLILQGEVEQIAQMPPKATNAHETGFLEFIDEVIGTKRYERPLDQLRTRMGELEFQREEKSQRVTLAEQHKTSLIEPMKKATAFLRDRNTRDRVNHELHQVKAYKCRKFREGHAEKLKELEETQTRIMERLEEIKKYNDERRHEYAQAEKAYQVAEAKFQKNKKAMNDADQKYVQLNQELKASNEERKKKKDEKEKAAKELEKLHGLPESNAKEIEKLDKRRAELEESIKAEEEATKDSVKKLMDQVDKCVAEKKKADAVFRGLKAAVDEKKAARDTMQKELDRCKANEIAEKEKLEKLQKDLEELQQSLARKSGLNIQPDVIPKKEAQARKLREEANKLTDIEQEKRGIYVNLRSQQNEAQNAMQGGSDLSRVDKALLGAKSQGSFPGLYGRLKDLAKIDEKYNIAATTATGMLDYWVVDNDSTGAECIQFLKDNGLPAETFVCLNKMDTRWYKRPFNTPANSLRIYDLLRIRNPELAPVYYKAFHDTLVCENIDIAGQVAYGIPGQRHRVVTIKGEIVESTGSMVGGGRAPTAGKFNSATAKRLERNMSKKDMETLAKNVAAAEKEYQEVTERKKKFEEDASAIETEIEELKRKVMHYQSDLETNRRMLPMKADMVREQEAKVKQATMSERTLQERQKRIDDANAELEKAREPYEEAEENVNALADQVKSLQTEKKKEILKKLDKFKDQHKRVLEEMKKLNVELRNCEKNKQKLESKIEKLAKEVDAIQTKMLAMSEEKKTLEEVASSVKAEETVLQEDKDAKFKVYNELKTKSSEFDQEEKKLNKQKVSVDNNVQSISAEIKDYERQERHYIASLQNFKLSEIPEVEVEPLQMLSEEQLEHGSVKDLETKLAKQNQKLKREEPNLNIIDDYNQACHTLLKRVQELDEVNTRRELISTAYLTLEAQRMKEFMEGYAMISAKVKELFRMISMGGDAELDLLDSTDPFSCGIDFSVRPRGKTWKKIINLSGGEKTLSSLALVFSLHHFKPSPFYVMDEIDAALDFQNVSIIANYIKERTKFTQFIIISLRSNMFELADSLLGVYKVDNMSYSIRIGVNNVVNKLKGIHRRENKAYIMGEDDNVGTGSKQQTASTITSSQQTTQPTQSQQQATMAARNPPGRRPSFDVSAINDPDHSRSTIEVPMEPASSNSEQTAAPSGSSNEAVGVVNSTSAATDNNDENMDEADDGYRDALMESFEEDSAHGPLASSTPFGNAPPRRMSVRQNLCEVKEEESGSDSDSSEIFASIHSSANNSQNTGDLDI